MNDELRQLVRERAKHSCEYCRIPQDVLPWARFHIEHIRARQHGGSDEVAKLALACRRCNAYKGPNLTAIDPATDQPAALFNPRSDIWDEHFEVVDFLIMGTTNIGRATAALLNMNDPDRVQLRIERAHLDSSD
jgi:hypothetical protein